MDFIFALCVLLFTFPTTALSGHCLISGDDSCIYTVTCVGHAGSVPQPTCSSEPYLTFIVSGITAETITAGYFGATNFDSRVRAIIAQNNTWTNIEQNTFKYYAKTVTMDLSNNKIANIKNEAFKFLLFLENLNVSHNFISTLNPKSFYHTEGRPLEIMYLDLSHNEIVELSRETFYYLPNLLHLDLSSNFIRTISDDCFTNLKNLTNLKLRNNRISSLNMTLINLKSLKELDISFNLILHLHGYETNRLSALEIANFSKNYIESIDSNCFNTVFNLKQLDLSFNYIKTNIDNVTFINSNNLSYLNYFGNNINKIDDNAFKHNNLNYFNFGNNNLTMDITAKTFLGFQNVTNLTFYNQSITSLKNESFSALINLVNLNLSRNLIKVVEKHTFLNASSLKLCDLSYNFINDLGFLCCLTNISELFLNNNYISMISTDEFKNQLFLQRLDLSFNRIILIEPNSLPLQNLQFLNLNGNFNITGVISKNIFSPAKLLRNLDLSHLKFNKVDKHSLVDMQGVAKLNLSHNAIEYIDPDNFINMDNMYSLDISNNLLKHVEINQSNLKTLKALYLNNNKIDNISKTFINASDLMYLQLSNNNISDLSNAFFENLINLKVLYISNNKLVTFNNVHTNALKKLADLRLGSNFLSEINLKYYPDLVSADLSNNSIASINSTFFENLTSLQSLDISINKIKSIQPGTFQNVKILKLLNLSSNFLQTLRYGSLKGLHRTELLDLSKNNLTELDIDVFHECNELTKLLIDYNKITTIDIERLLLIVPKLQSLSLGGNPISCKEIVRNIKIVNRTSIKQLEVTAIDKIYHEDNVLGIKCGDFSKNISDTSTVEDAKSNSSASSVVVLVWCILIIIIIVALGFGVYLYKKSEICLKDSGTAYRLRHSLELNGSDYQNDLLS